MEDIPIIRQHLQQIVSLMQQTGDGVAAACRHVVAELNRLNDSQRQWGWSYVHQVMRGKLRPSQRFARSVKLLHARLTGLSTEYEAVTVIVRTGTVHPNSVVEAASRKCAYANCGRMFIPTHPSQKYCHTPTCLKSKRRIHNVT